MRVIMSVSLRGIIGIRRPRSNLAGTVPKVILIARNYSAIGSKKCRTCFGRLLRRFCCG